MKKRKIDIYRSLIPLYRCGKEFWVVFNDDLPVDDSPNFDFLIIKVNMNGTFDSNLWSFQKMMKYNGAYMEFIPSNKMKYHQRYLFSKFTLEALEDIKNILNDPPKLSVESLVFKVPRLINK